MLSADVRHKFEDTIPIWGNVGVYHLDEIFDSNRSTYFALLQCCASMSRRTTSTIFIFLSPQFLVNHQDARDVFIEGMIGSNPQWYTARSLVSHP
jgi:hypothetical protein